MPSSEIAQALAQDQIEITEKAPKLKFAKAKILNFSRLFGEYRNHFDDFIQVAPAEKVAGGAPAKA